MTYSAPPNDVDLALDIQRSAGVFLWQEEGIRQVAFYAPLATCL